MGIVRRSHKRGITGSIFLSSTINGTTVHLVPRQGLLQRGMLRGANGLQLIQIHQQVVGQGHLLIKPVGKVNGVLIILLQMPRQQATEEGGLTTTLGSDERRHHLISMKAVHLQPMGYS